MICLLCGTGCHSLWSPFLGLNPACETEQLLDCLENHPARQQKSFDKAVEQGRKLAQKYQQLAITKPSAFVRLPLHELRSQGIWPME
jgi:hypothetical protein